MPRKKKTAKIGIRKKYSRSKKRPDVGDTAEVSVLQDHTYSKVQPRLLDEKSQKDLLWNAAWLSFFIETCDDQPDCSIQQDQVIGNQDSDGFIAEKFYVVLDKVYEYDPEENLDHYVSGIIRHKRYEQFVTLKKHIVDCVVELEDFQLGNNRPDHIQIVQFYEGNVASVKFSVNITPAFTATVHVHRRKIEDDHELWTGLPKVFSTAEDVRKLLSRLSGFSVCAGNYDDKFGNLVPIGTGLSDNSSKEVTAYREGDFGASIDGTAYTSTIRSSNCHFLTRSSRCGPCCHYRATLRSILRRQSLSPKPSRQPSFTHKTHKSMTKDELIHKFDLMKEQRNAVQTELHRLKRGIRQTFEQKGRLRSPEFSSDFGKLFKEYSEEIKTSYRDDTSIQRLFWEQQMKFSKLGDKRGMRWHPMIIKWCLYLRNKSRKGYEVARNSGFKSLPSNRTLFDYSHTLPNSLGFQPEYTQHLKEEAKALGMLDIDSRSYVGILQDEVKVSEGLVYDKHSGELVGYVDLDKTGNELQCLEDTIKERKSQLANTVLVVMIRGIVTDLRYPFAAFATRGITADFLYPIMWDAVLTLESIGLKPLFITCDGASPNRKFFNMHLIPELDNFYWTWNPYAVPDRKLFFISDVPHLLKTTRNCFSNSGSHKRTRDLWKNGRNISWLHILRLYEEHVENSLFSKTYKLTRDHVDLTPYSTMKVNLAAQIFSSTVANALEDIYGDQVKETVEFVRKMNRFFDCLNSSNLQESNKTRNSDKAVYRSTDDPRFDFLLNEFLDYFKEWEESVMARRGNYRQKDRMRMMLSHQTLKGLKISINSIVECVKFILKTGADFVLTHRFNQDPLEEQFGQYRHKGGSNDNPSVYVVKHNFRNEGYWLICLTAN